MQSIKFNKQTLYPSKVVCIGRNYVAHINELENKMPDEPVIFIKPNSSIHNKVCFNKNERIDYESEISFLIKSGEIAAVGFGLDLTKRNLQAKLKNQGLPWERAKAFDKSAVFSEFVNFECDVNDLSIELYVNDKLVQSASCKLMLTKPNEFLREVKSFMTLEDNDLLMSGTPKGVGEIHLGDTLLGKIIHENETLVQSSWVVE